MTKLKFGLLFLLLGFGLFAKAEVQDERISISFKDVTIKDALSTIESKTSFKFTYGEIPALEKKISKSFNNERISVILKEVLNKNGIGYEIVGNNIALFNQIKKKNQKKITVSGYVYDANSGEALIGCKIYEKLQGVGAITNNFGFFSLSLNEGSYAFLVSYIGYEKTIIESNESTVLNIKLKPVNSDLNVVVVDAEKRTETVENTDMGKIKLTSREINAIPAIGGEVDVLKAITLLPGIKQGVDGSSGFYVRGGGPDQNLILLDGVPLYNPYHLWGFYLLSMQRPLIILR